MPGGATSSDRGLAIRLEQCQWDFFWLPADWLVVDRPELGYVVSTRGSEILSPSAALLGLRGGQAVAAGAMTLYPALGSVFFWGGCTRPGVRSRGHYRSLVNYRLALARERGFEVAGIYAREHSSAPILSRLGFRKVGTMRYWDRGKREARSL